MNDKTGAEFSIEGMPWGTTRPVEWWVWVYPPGGGRYKSRGSPHRTRREAKAEIDRLKRQD